MRQIYLDYNATTPIAPSVQEAMEPFLTQHYGNPSSHHSLGRTAHEAVEDAREQVARLIGATAEEIVFTSGGTESSNLAIKGAAYQAAPSGTGHLIISALEHPATAEPARYLERQGYGLSIASCDQHGVVDVAAVDAAMSPETFLVSIMHSNNETGSIQPIREIAELCRSRGVLLHCDAAQSIGKVPIDVNQIQVDLLTIAGHKMYAPKGVGALYVRQGVALEPILHGAGHERGIRSGTENVPYLVGLGKASVLATKGLEEMCDRLALLRDRLQQKLVEVLGDRLVIHSQLAPRLPNTLSVSLPGVNGYEVLARTEELCASTGSACHSGSVAISPTLEAMGVDELTARGTIRLSVGWTTSEEQIDRASELLLDAWESLG